MHTVIPIDDGIGNTLEYRVVHVNTPKAIIAVFSPAGDTEDQSAINDAAHLCNRLNGGFSSELAALVLHLQPLLEFAKAQMAKEQDKYGG